MTSNIIIGLLIFLLCIFGYGLYNLYISNIHYEKIYKYNLKQLAKLEQRVHNAEADCSYKDNLLTSLKKKNETYLFELNACKRKMLSYKKELQNIRKKYEK